ncbi:MAG: hypothetical protein ACOYU6_07945 [Bacteroidota bacterium]|uniref:hypothetical protein n=1 Tax=Hydrotalea lipotrueae TaxID=2803817 RepID=UPI001C48C2C4|nr:hypothetical protein [Hydrotalea lipotrueae]
MKTIQILFIAITCFAIISCKKSVNQLSLLPPITDTGANTFGCLVNNIASLPKNGNPTWSTPFGKEGVSVIFGSDWIEFYVGNYQDGKPINSMMIHLQNVQQLKSGDYNWKQTTYENAVTGFPVYYENHIYCRAFDYNKNIWIYYGSYDSSGKITITNYDALKHIISGTFYGKLCEKNGTDTISITNGRFDINWTTIRYKKF